MDFVKKEWQFRDIISENELNRMEDGIEEGITKAEQAQQTATDAQTNLDNHVSATTGVHGATNAASPNTIVQRDSAGRFKAAPPAASDDVARKAEVDAITTEIINTTTYKTASEPGSSYPIGITTFSVTDGIADGWPVDGGVVLTIRLSNVRCLQIFSGSHASNATNGRLFNRSWRNDAGWSVWRRQWDSQEMGAGSGLDADMLDGMQSSRFVFGDNDRGSTTYAGNLDDVDRSGFYYGFTGHTNSPTGTNGQFIHVQRGDAQALQIYQPFNSDELYFRKKNTSWGSWQKLVKKSELDAHIGSGGSAHAVATTSQAGFMSASDKSKLNGIEAGAQVNTVTSVAGKTGAVTLSKSDVGLGNVQNYGIASQSQAQAGTDNASYMTPLRTKQAIDQFVPYETGTWTPELTFGNSSSGITYSNRKGQYTRIRNVVYWTMEMQLSSKGTATGTARISGLPFIPLSTAPDVILPVGYATRITLPSGGEWASAQIFWNSAVLVLFASGNVGTNANITNEHFADNSGLKIQGFYFIPN